MIVRAATDQDWLLIYPFFTAIVASGETYAYPEGLSLDEAEAYWFAEPPVRASIRPGWRLCQERSRCASRTQDGPHAIPVWASSLGRLSPAAVNAEGIVLGGR